MEALFHLVFELVKIAILASVYAYLVILLFQFIGKKGNSGNWFESVSKKKLKLWFSTGLVISFLLFLFMFSYWGNHGFGDHYKIPIGNGYIVERINSNDYGFIGNIKTVNSESVDVEKFKVKNGKLIGKLDNNFYDYENSYFIFDLETKKMQEFKNKSLYNNFAISSSLPIASELLSFRANYDKRWGGWRFFLLP